MTESTVPCDTPERLNTAGSPATAISGESRTADLWERQRAIVAMGRRASAPPDLPVLMQDAVDLLAEVLGAQYRLVAELQSEGQPPCLRVTLRAAGDTTADAPSCEISAGGSNSLPGYALQVARPVVVTDLSRETRFVDEFLANQEIRAAVAVPLKLADRAFGSLAVCTKEVRSFDDEDLLFVETIAHLVATTIGRTQAETLLDQQRRLASGVLKTVDALVLVLDSRGQIVSVNAACERLTGFSLDEIKGRRAWSVFSSAKEAAAFQGVVERLRETKSPVEHENCLLTKHSHQRRIAWSCDVMDRGDGSETSIIATGIDVTGQREAEAKAEQALQTAQQAREAMARALHAAESGPVPNPEALLANTGSGQLPLSAHVERRRHPRRCFPYKQRIAAVLDEKLPERDAFEDVQCRDIAASGFSYHSPTPPASDTLVVALGAPPKVTHLVAQVVHVTRVEKQGKKKYLVGCNYVGRAAY